MNNTNNSCETFVNNVKFGVEETVNTERVNDI